MKSSVSEIPAGVNGKTSNLFYSVFPSRPEDIYFKDDIKVFLLLCVSFVVCQLMKTERWGNVGMGV